jgi:cold shock CspA family protein
MENVGTIHDYDAQKGWGFIEPVAGGRDIFFHRSNVLMEEDSRELVPGTPVEFTVGYDKRQRRCAIAVRPF